MSESESDDTTEQSVDELKQRIEELEDRVERQEQSHGMSRRGYLGSLVGMASAGAAGYYYGTRTVSAAPSWGSASGQMGTEAKPYSQVISKQVTAQTLNTGKVSTENFDPDYRLAEATHWREDSTQSTTSTSFTNLLDAEVGLDFDAVPAGTTLYGRFFARASIDNNAETVTCVPRVFDDSTASGENITALDVSTSATSLTVLDSGWTDLSGISTDGIGFIVGASVKVTGSTGNLTPQGTSLYLAGSVQ